MREPLPGEELLFQYQPPSQVPYLLQPQKSLEVETTPPRLPTSPYEDPRDVLWGWRTLGYVPDRTRCLESRGGYVEVLRFLGRVTEDGLLSETTPGVFWTTENKFVPD